MHRFAEKAALAALAAARQGKYREMSAALFTDSRKLSDETIQKDAEKVGLDMEQFNKDLKDPAIKKQIQSDLRLGSAVKVRGVPAIFINGRAPKQRSLQGFSQMIEEELKKSK